LYLHLPSRCRHTNAKNEAKKKNEAQEAEIKKYKAAVAKLKEGGSTAAPSQAAGLFSAGAALFTTATATSSADDAALLRQQHKRLKETEQEVPLHSSIYSQALSCSNP
jgi:hypothetical protein